MNGPSKADRNETAEDTGTGTPVLAERAGRLLALALTPLAAVVAPLHRRGWNVTAAVLCLVIVAAVASGVGVGLVAAGQDLLPAKPGYGGLLAVLATLCGGLLVAAGKAAGFLLLCGLPLAIGADAFRTAR
ncbi:hypothetical protein ACFZDG_35810 [Kitasatospora xanthocidica]|uniref:hypothetical protein n=1 Tax=Kitasatospora xanthocidica TaxID=83382 RepID=UPI0036E91AB3